jgi:hypothetical protein
MRSLLLLLPALLLAPLAPAQPVAMGTAVSAAPLAALVTAQHAPAPLAALAADEPVSLSVFPNPVVEFATVRFSIERSQRVELDVFDLLGRRVRQLDLGVATPGEHEASFDLRSLPAGLYIIRLSGDRGARATIRMTRAMGS